MLKQRWSVPVGRSPIMVLAAAFLMLCTLHPLRAEDDLSRRMVVGIESGFLIAPVQNIGTYQAHVVTLAQTGISVRYNLRSDVAVKVGWGISGHFRLPGDGFASLLTESIEFRQERPLLRSRDGLIRWYWGGALKYGFFPGAGVGPAFGLMASRKDTPVEIEVGAYPTLILSNSDIRQQMATTLSLDFAF